MKIVYINNNYIEIEKKRDSESTKGRKDEESNVNKTNSNTISRTETNHGNKEFNEIIKDAIRIVKEFVELLKDIYYFFVRKYQETSIQNKKVVIGIAVLAVVLIMISRCF